MEYITIIYNLIIYISVMNVKVKTVYSCQQQTTDIIFMLDSSYSLHNNQFEQQLQFVSNVVERFDIGTDKTQVGVLTFNHNVRVEFHLNAFLDKTKLKHSILNIPYSKGGTDIGQAIHYARTEMFKTQNGGRKNAKRLFVVITDGESEDQTKTESEARQSRLAGIHIISVGVGNTPNDNELMRIASEPQFVFKVDDFISLDSIVGSLSRQTCNEPKATEDDNLVSEEGCNGRPLDVFFVIDNSNSIWYQNFKKVLKFVTELISNLQMSSSRTRFGVLSYSDDVHLKLPLQHFVDTNEIIDEVINYEQLTGGTETGKAIQFLTRYGFSDSDSAKVAIVLTDGKSKQPEETKMAVDAAKKQGINFISVGIEEQSDREELAYIASSPKEKFLFHVKDYDALESIKDRLLLTTCNVQADNQQKESHMCRFPVNTAITFIYDSSTVGLHSSKIIRKSIVNVVKGIDIGNNNTKIGVLSKTCSKQKNVFFSDYKQRSEFINSLTTKQPDGLAHLLRKYRIKYYRINHRENRKKSIVVLFIDEDLSFPETAWIEAKRTSIKSEIYVVSIGSIINKHQSENLCSKPSSHYLYHSENYNELPYIVLKLFRRICR